MIFIDGQEASIPLDQLIAKGRELIASGYPQTATTFTQDMDEACTAVHWFDEQHRLYVESQAAADAGIGRNQAQPARI